MKIFITLILGLLSFGALADCESSLTEFHVGFPLWSSSSHNTSFYLTSKYEQMTIVVQDADRSNPRYRPLYDVLDEAGYTNGVINFGVTRGVCVYLDEYQLPIGFGGSWTSLDVKNITFITRTDPH